MRLEKIINTAYSFGAAVVVFGAWGKLEHKDFGDTALTAGLLTETAIFCIYGFLEWRKDPVPQPADQKTTSFGGSASPEEVGELTATMKQTNQILNKVFKAG
ncbi:MAG TPA: hypothetical protein VNS58_03925 [Puia sp.]|nr:hypothetical protein [Puia sp.]